MEPTYLSFRASAWPVRPEDEMRDLVGEAIRLYLDELDRDDDRGAESVVVSHFTVAV